MDVSRIGGNNHSATVMHSNSKRPSALMGNNTALNQNKTANVAVTIDISEEARNILMGHGKLGKDNHDLKKLSLKNNPENSLEGMTLEDALAKVDEYKSKSVIDNEVKNDFSNQFVQNEYLDKVDELYINTINEMLKNDLEEMHSRSQMALFLADGLGMTTGRVDLSEDGVAKMMELYKKKLEEGTLDSEHAKIRDLDTFNKYCEKYQKDMENYANKHETLNVLLQKIEGTIPSKTIFDKQTISDNFSNSTTATPAVEVSFDFNEARKASRKAAVDAAVGEEKKDLEMRMYWGEYTDIFTGGSPNGWGRINMDTMYSQAAEIYKQIEDSSDNEETKALKFKALENALQTGTGFYSMNKVIEKMRNDALEAEAQGKTVDRSYRSKAKFDKLSAMSGAFQNITSMFFNNLKNGKTEGIDYGAMISDAVSKMMSYRHPS